MTLGERIKHYRNLHGFTQQQLAEQLNLTRQTISKWETDKSLPDIENIVLMSTIFSITLDDFLKIEIDQQMIKQKNKKREVRNLLNKIVIATISVIIVILLFFGFYKYNYLYGSKEGEVITLYGVTDVIQEDGQIYVITLSGKVKANSFNDVIKFNLLKNTDSNRSHSLEIDRDFLRSMFD